VESGRHWGGEAVDASAWRKEKEEQVPVRRGRATLPERTARAVEAGWQTGEGGGAWATREDGAREMAERCRRVDVSRRRAGPGFK
jgi:hypothetical protein